MIYPLKVDISILNSKEIKNNTSSCKVPAFFPVVDIDKKITVLKLLRILI